MARLNVPHHPDRVFKDDWWEQTDHTSPSGYRALPTESDSLEAFAVVLESNSTGSEIMLASNMMVLGEPFERVESYRQDGWAVVIGFYSPEAS